MLSSVTFKFKLFSQKNNFLIYFFCIGLGGSSCSEKNNNKNFFDGEENPIFHQFLTVQDTTQCWEFSIKKINHSFYLSMDIYFEIYCHDNILHFEITQRGKPIFAHEFKVSLPHTTQIFLKIDGGESRN